MGKYLKPTRVPYEESSRYSGINFSCPENLKGKLLNVIIFKIVCMLFNII